MARPTKYAIPICLGLTALAGLGVALGFVTDEVMWPVVLLVPTVAYEAYRTEGVSTRWASWLMLVLMIGLVVVVAFDIEYDVRELLGSNVAYIGGRGRPVGRHQGGVPGGHGDPRRTPLGSHPGRLHPLARGDHLRDRGRDRVPAGTRRDPPTARYRGVSSARRQVAQAFRRSSRVPRRRSSSPPPTPPSPQAGSRAALMHSAATSE